MRDAVSIPRVRKLHPKVANEVFAVISQVEAAWPPTIAVRVAEGLRTIKEQDELYARGRNGDTRPKVTNAKGGSSFHNYGVAFDFALLVDKDHNGTFDTLLWDENKPEWKQVVNAFESAGWFWGGNFSKLHDAPHLQKAFGNTWQQLKAKYDAGDFITGTEYVNL